MEAGAAEITYRLINFTVLRRSVVVADGQVTPASAVMTLALSADVVVTGARTFRNIAEMENPAENLVGIAASSSQGAITAAQLETRPMMRAGEVLETVPGLIISQHSGEGKANQYYLRGFNLDHGTDFSTSVAGLPVNTPTGAHAHGYADISFIIPELVSGVQFKKGPYFADEGDFSAAGAASISYVSSLDRPLVRLSAGGQGWGRFLGAVSPKVGDGHLLAALEIGHTDGPWQRPDDYQKTNAVVRYSRGTAQQRLLAHRHGLLGRLAIHRSGAAARHRRGPHRPVRPHRCVGPGPGEPADGSCGLAAFVRACFLACHRLRAAEQPEPVLELHLLPGPSRGGRSVRAGRAAGHGRRPHHLPPARALLRPARRELGRRAAPSRLARPVGLYHTANAARLSTTREDRVGQTMAGLFAQTEIEWTRTVRTTLGLRTDAYQYTVTSDARSTRVTACPAS